MSINELPCSRPRQDRNLPWLILVAALLLPVAAVWTVSGFVTQDGPAHLYNAEIINKSLQANSPFESYFRVRWQPLPNWAGHLLTAGFLATFPARVADRAMTTLTLIALPVALFWLRARVSGLAGLGLAPFLVSILGMNVTWLLGFNSFAIGASLFPITLGCWWGGRSEGWSPRRSALLASLVALGYFCHLISLGLTALGLVVLEGFTPRPKAKRICTTAVALLPLGPLAGLYLSLMRKGGGGLAPEWKHLTNLGSLRSWITQLTWVDPLSLARKDYLPILGTVASWHNALATVVLTGLALAILLPLSPFRDREIRGWWVLGFVLLAIGLGGPDTLGATHGEYLQQRIVLLGLVALVPVLPLGRSGWLASGAGGLIVAAYLLQTLMVWDYAAWSDRTAGSILRSADLIGTNQRVGTLLNDIRSPFRSNPILHADCGLGVGTGNIIWANYETRFYYFPVQFQEGLEHPDALDFERVALAKDARERRVLWKAILDRHRQRFDTLIVWGANPAIDADNAEVFETVSERSRIRILRRRP